MMSKSQNKTQPTNSSVTQYLSAIEDPQIRQDSQQIVKIMRRISGKKAVLWSAGILGYGTFHYQYASGREGDWMRIGLAPRKREMSLYLTMDITQFAEILQRLGKHKTGKGCLYIRKLADVDLEVLEELIQAAWNKSLEQYP